MTTHSPPPALSRVGSPRAYCGVYILIGMGLDHGVKWKRKDGDPSHSKDHHNIKHVDNIITEGHFEL